MNKHLNKREYNGDYSYKISNEIQKHSCESCGETVSPFDCNNYTLDAEVKCVSAEVFKSLAREVYQLK